MLYVAFDPYKEPRYAVSILVEHGGSEVKQLHLLLKNYLSNNRQARTKRKN